MCTEFSQVALLQEMELIRVIWKGLHQIKYKGAICFEGSGIRVDFLRGIWKPLRKDGVIDVRCLIYADATWGLDDAYIEIGELRNFLGGHREVFVDSCKEVFEEVDYGVGTKEVIYGASNYYNVIGGVCIKGVEIMVYGMLDKAQVGEDQVEYCIPMESSRFSRLNPMADIHGIDSIKGRLYADDREV